MAPEPCATLSIERALNHTDEWVLDGFPRSIRQLPSVQHEAIVYLDINTRTALKRAIARGRNTPEIERYRITEQLQLLAPIRAQSAVVIPVSFMAPDQVVNAIVNWYINDVHPQAYGSGVR